MSPGLRPPTFVTHAINGSRRRPSGKKPLEGTAAISFLGDRDLPRLRWRCSGNITPTRFQSWPPSIVARKVAVPMACIIWQGMRPSGSKTGLGSTTMRLCRTAIPTDLPMAGTRWCAEDRGRVRRLCCERPPEAGHRRINAPRPLGFAARDPRNSRLRKNMLQTKVSTILHRYSNRGAVLQDAQKGRQRGRSERGGEAYPCGTLSLRAMREQSWRAFSASC
jgi:hypothetical protein